jgi:hypothetical protein
MSHPRRQYFSRAELFENCGVESCWKFKILTKNVGHCTILILI